ncbi:MAG: hypothetical protein DWQ49_05530 [Bacteroidetes bacterium]|nr:MAG: hypothetical protein DWQ49_05530 [Bacteroidota bacterium]
MEHTPINEKWNGKQLFRGERGGMYYVDEAGRRKYVNKAGRKQTHKRKTKADKPPKPRPGAFQRYLRHQQELQ